MIPFQITFRDIPPSDAIWLAVQKRIERLEKFFERAVSCTVTISSPHHHKHKGKLYHIVIRLSVPGNDVIVTREPEKNAAHEDIYVAIRDAFNALDRRLEDKSRKLRGQVKERAAQPHAHIARLFPYEGYGFIKTPDGRELYFNKNAILNAEFDKLEVGEEVRFHEERGEEGAQASSISTLKRRHKVVPPLETGI